MTTMFKSADGTEWVLVPKVATEEMVKNIDSWTDLVDASTTGAHESDEWKQAMRLKEFSLAYSVALEAAPQPPLDEMVASVSEILTEFSDVECSFDTISRAIVARLIGEKPLGPPVTEDQSASNYSPTLSTEDDR